MATCHITVACPVDAPVHGRAMQIPANIRTFGSSAGHLATCLRVNTLAASPASKQACLLTALLPFRNPCYPGPRDVRLHVSATVQDVMIQDLRAQPEHSLVLTPNRGAEYCSLVAKFSTFVDPSKAMPSLVLQLHVGGSAGELALGGVFGGWREGKERKGDGGERVW